MTNSRKENISKLLLLFFSICSFIFVFNIQQTILAQEVSTNDTEEQLAQVQINGSSTITPFEEETVFEGLDEPSAPSLEQQKAFEEEIAEEERVYPQEFQKITEGAEGLSETEVNPSTATNILVSPPTLDVAISENITDSAENITDSTQRTMTQNAELSQPIKLYKNTIVTPVQYKSTVTEPSVANKGPTVFYTGNWFAARSDNYGANWKYINPLQGMSDFCCNQDVIYDKKYKIFLWYRQGIKDVNGENRFILSVSKDAKTWTSYSVTPSAINSSWKKNWWDYPALALSDSKLYISSNMFDKNKIFVQSVMLQLDLKDLSMSSKVHFQYYSESSQFNYTPVQGATKIMYWAVHNTNAQMKLYKWDETSNIISIGYRNHPAFQWGEMKCPGPDQLNWCERSDSRILAGWVRDGEVAFAWNVKQGGSFNYPYVNVIIFKENGLTYKSNPIMWNPTTAWMFPSFAPNFSDGQIGVVAYYGGGSFYPSIAAGVFKTSIDNPPPYPMYNIKSGTNGAERWGDYDRARPLSGAGPLFEGSAVTLQGCISGDCIEPRYFIFGK